MAIFFSKTPHQAGFSYFIAIFDLISGVFRIKGDEVDKLKLMRAREATV
jgi:hypothetical protein